MGSHVHTEECKISKTEVWSDHYDYGGLEILWRGIKDYGGQKWGKGIPIRGNSMGIFGNKGMQVCESSGAENTEHL